jgi:hypothetical protein
MLNRKESSKLETADMRFRRPLLGFIGFNHQRNYDIREFLQLINTARGYARIPTKLEKYFVKKGKKENSTVGILLLAYGIIKKQ